MKIRSTGCKPRIAVTCVIPHTENSAYRKLVGLTSLVKQDSESYNKTTKMKIGYHFAISEFTYFNIVCVSATIILSLYQCFLHFPQVLEICHL